MKPNLQPLWSAGLVALLTTTLSACGGESSSEPPVITEAGLDADAAPSNEQDHDAAPAADDVSSPRADGAMATDASFDRATLEVGSDAASLTDTRSDSASTPDVRADSAPPVDAHAEAGGDGAPRDASGCAVAVTAPLGPKAARSSGYAGTGSDYSKLYEVQCTGLAQCSAACELAGGTAASCAAGSECNESPPKHCLPPTYWFSTELALMEDADGNSSAVLTLVKIGYNDPLAVTNFGISIPSGATIRGIQFDVRRNASDEQAVDDSVHILKNGVPVGPDRSKTAPWPAELAYVSYGGPSDTWGQTWTAADLQATGFGLAIAARYTETAGNARAYVDFVRAQVYYTPAGCE